MTAAVALEVPEPERKRRATPQAEVPGRAPLCPVCWHLEDTLGHFWICVTRNGRRRLGGVS